ncbi:predicted protein [Naegleria gruberi]|uniref:Predicted protein n=1 Tax=Naegleria gruberi TaxID=5762 RepID=D2W133_NAEGR|nr:uncharacterized protein NAEGRDRAFT_53878 [Naegleria gruberi]EFC37242.1 predicted protein [Naegleria gruberi]|eukprot:XP_002669986.1 predicted protein [Naegleria gruberi strain NEG-M]
MKKTINGGNKLYNEQKDLRERVDQYLKEAFENRLASMMNLRVQMEELASAHKQEEDNYVHTIREILRRSTFENERRREVESSLKGKLNEVEGKLKTEFIEKQKTYEEFQNFKEKGTSIIYRLRDSLKKITEKYKEEKQKNSSLKKQLKECEDAWEDEVKKRERFESIINEKQSSNDIIWQEKFARMKEKNVQLLDEIQELEEKLHLQQEKAISASNNGESEDWKKKEKVFETKIKEFQRLLEEEESLIEDLKRKLSIKQQENSELSKELERVKLERGMSKEILDTTSVEIPKEYLDVYTEIKGLLDPEDNKNLQMDANPQDKIKAQNRFIRLLLTKLKSEEHNRVKTHKENISIVLEQEKTISFLEKKIRELENIVIEQKEQAQKESLRISKLVKGEQIDEEADDGKLRELEQKLDIITQEMNNSIRSIQEAREEKMILEEEIEEEDDEEFTTHSLKEEETEPLETNETEEIIEERLSISDNSQDELIADCKEDDEDV